MNLLTEPYLAQTARLPKTGRHILAQFDDESVIVYQAYRPAIGHFAAQHGYFGGAVQPEPHELDQAQLPLDDVPLRLGVEGGAGGRACRAAETDRPLTRSCGGLSTPPSCPRSTKAKSAWKAAVGRSDVRLQFDPDHNPSGAPVERRAIQLGLRGEVLAKYAREWLLGIEDVSEFVREQREHARSPYDRLVTPREEVYPVN